MKSKKNRFVIETISQFESEGKIESQPQNGA